VLTDESHRILFGSWVPSLHLSAMSAILGALVSKDTQFSIRLEKDVAERAEALVAKLGGIASRAALLRMAMVEGLAVLEERYRDFPGGGSAAASPKRRGKR